MTLAISIVYHNSSAALFKNLEPLIQVNSNQGIRLGKNYKWTKWSWHPLARQTEAKILTVRSAPNDSVASIKANDFARWLRIMKYGNTRTLKNGTRVAIKPNGSLVITAPDSFRVTMYESLPGCLKLRVSKYNRQLTESVELPAHITNPIISTKATACRAIARDLYLTATLSPNVFLEDIDETTVKLMLRYAKDVYAALQ